MREYNFQTWSSSSTSPRYLNQCLCLSLPLQKGSLNFCFIKKPGLCQIRNPGSLIRKMFSVLGEILKVHFLNEIFPLSSRLWLLKQNIILSIICFSTSLIQSHSRLNDLMNSLKKASKSPLQDG